METIEQAQNLSSDERLDKPLLSVMRVNWQTIALLVIVVALVLTRLVDAGNRAYCHDESAHAWESWRLYTGQRYTHDPVFHGPFLYHLTAFVYFLLGIDDVTTRIGASLLAILLVLSVWPLRRWMGRAGALFAMALLTISPTMMFRGRFIRHDVVVMASTMVVIGCVFRYLEDRKDQWLLVISAALAVAFCGKANAFINGVVLGSFLVLLFLVQWAKTRGQPKELASFDLVLILATLALPLVSAVVLKVLGFNPLDYSAAGLLRIRVIVLALFAISAAVGVWWRGRIWLAAAGIYNAIFFLLYTTMLTNARGMESGLVGMLGYWLSQQGVARGGQPWYYYLFLDLVYEFLPLLLAVLGAIYYLVTRRRRVRTDSPTEADAAGPAFSRAVFVPFLLYWVALNIAIFTWSGEKMPWQNQHIVLPLGLLGGWFLGQVWERTDWRRMFDRGAMQALAVLPVAVLSLVVLILTTLRRPGPFGGMGLEQLQVTLLWLLALLVLLIAIAFLYRYGRTLGVGGWSRVALAFAVLVLGAATVRSALMASFINQDYATEFLVFAASTPDTAMVMDELNELAWRLKGVEPLRVAYDNESQQPFFWYLRDWDNVVFFTGESSLSGDPHVVIVGPENEGKLKAQLTGRYIRRDHRLIWWPDEQVYRNLTPGKLWADLKDPARRRYWWDILWMRKYPQSTTAWPLVHKFALYLRRDLATKVWESGSAVVPPSVVLPEDEYEGKRIEQTAVLSWGSFGSGEGQFNYPKGMAVDEKGRVYVADSYNHRVQVFDANGRFLRQWGSQGNEAGQFQEPWGIAVGADGTVYVADTWNHRIQKFDAEGKWLQQWGTFGDTGGVLGATGVFYGPRDLAVEANGGVLVSDTGNKRILRFTTEGQFVGQWGGEGAMGGQFREPVGVALDSMGNIYVADTWNQRIQKFDASFTLVAQWPVLGWEGESVTNKPYLTVDGRGNVYVSGPDYHWVVRVDAAGQVDAVWGQYGSDLRSFNMPSGIAVGPKGEVYVLDSANHRVLQFAAMP